jgi:HlyD family secretion protein
MKRKTLLIVLAAIVLITVVTLAVLKKKGKIGSQPGPKISTELTEKRDIIGTVSANGKIQPEMEVIINPDASGEIVELPVKEGQKVKKGTLLAKINPEFYQSSLDKSISSLNTQKANLANMKARLSQVEAQFINTQLNFDRSKSLWEKKTISQSEFDAAKAQIDVSKAEVDAARQSVIAAQYTVSTGEAAVKEARDYLRKTAIYAPMDGTVTRLTKEVGERVAGASQFSAGTEIMRISNLGEMEVNVEVSENDIIRVNLFDTASIEVDAYPDRKFQGIVTEIANSAKSSLGASTSIDQVTNFEVKIRILRSSYEDLLPGTEDDQSPFRPGMSATVDIQTEIVRQVISIPVEAVTVKADSTNEDGVKADASENEFVFIYENGTAKKIKVETGVQDEAFIEIKKGLGLGDEVIIAPYRVVHRKLEDGDKVQKVKKELLFSGSE